MSKFSPATPAPLEEEYVNKPGALTSALKQYREQQTALLAAAEEYHRMQISLSLEEYLNRNNSLADTFLDLYTLPEYLEAYRPPVGFEGFREDARRIREYFQKAVAPFAGTRP